MSTPPDDGFRRAMVVAAHADDAEWGCGGAVARWCAAGWSVAYVLCTDGSKGSDDPAITAAELVQIRQREQDAAGRILGLSEITFLGYPDAGLEPTLALRKDLTRQIRRHRPDILVCMNPARNFGHHGYIDHPDHLAAGEAAMAAAFPAARDRLTFPELIADENLPPHKVKEVWIMGYPDPDRYVDITDYADTAVAALRAHRSQVGSAEVGRYLKETWRRNGGVIGVKYAEAFKRFQLS